MSNFESAIEQAKQFASTSEGRQLAQLLQQTGGIDLQQALDQAAAGNLQQAKKTLSQLLNDPQARKLLEKLGGGNG